MKKYIFISIAAILAFLTSCEQETLPTYSGTDQIYFSYADHPSWYDIGKIVDSTIIQFGYDRIIKQDSTIEVEVSIQGSIVEYDRPVNFTLNERSTAKLGRDIVLLPEISYVPAGKRSGNIVLKLLNTENLNNTTLLASLELLENEHFKADFHLTSNPYVNSDIRSGKIQLNSTQYHIWFNNENEMPNWWANPTFALRFNMIFGTYSKAKFKLMCEILPGCSREYFTYEGNPTATELNTLFSTQFPMGLLAAWAMRLNNYLNDYKEKNGTPLLDENGNEIKSGTMYT